jgi:hypothetical protein
MLARNAITKGLMGAAMMMGLTASAYAVPWQLGSNLIEDDSNEYLFRSDGAGGYVPVVGDLAVGDFVVQVLDFPLINGINIDSLGEEVTGVSVFQIGAIVPTGLHDPDGGGPLGAYAAGTFDFVAAAATDWFGLTGITPTNADVMSILYQDPANNLDVFAMGLVAGLAAATDGMEIMELALNGGGDFATAVQLPLDPGVFAPDSVGEVPGVTQYGTFNYQLTIASEDIPGINALGAKLSGTGTNLVAFDPAIAPVIDDTQASFTAVPEPATLSLLGLGFLGAGLMRRRQQRNAM